MNIIIAATKYAVVTAMALGLVCINPALAADLESAKALVKAKACHSCHGLSGNTGSDGEAPVPKLAGQPRDYLVKAMRDYRSGERKDETMNLLMAPRIDEEIEMIADYFTAQKRY